MHEDFLEIERHPDGVIVLRFKSPKLWGIPEPTRQHLMTAQKEMLLALRTMLDKAIEKTEETEKTKAKRKTKIEVK